MFFDLFVKLAGLLLFSAIFSSCISTQAHWQKKIYQPEKQGVVYYDPRPNFFDKSAVQQRKQDAKMKMRSFCDPKREKIISEKKAEEVIGRHTYFSSHKDNPNPTYQESVTANERLYKKSAQVISQSILSSSGSQTEEDIIRERIYITFICE